MEEKYKNKFNNNLFTNIKSNYILKKIFFLLYDDIKLEIIKYNKAIQNKLKIKLDDYIEEFYKIKIEIIPRKIIGNKIGLNNFIKIPFPNLKDYCHIYFYGNETKVNRTYLIKEDKVYKIIIVLDKEFNCFAKLFQSCHCNEEINFRRFNRNDIKDLSYMFSYCESLKKIDLSRLITINTTNMKNMFFSCKSLKQLNLSNFDTRKVTNMSYMFSNSHLLKELNLSNFNTNNVTNMECMFLNCSSLKRLNVSSFNTEKVVDMSFMFHGCLSLLYFNLSSFKINDCNVNYMFSKCYLYVHNRAKKQIKNISDEAFCYFNGYK